MTYFFHIAYDGSKYCGWQSQKNSLSVQEQLEKYIEKILGFFVTVKGCGRTDSGVHATQYFFHIDIEITLTPDFKFVLNQNLPKDIQVFEILEMPPGSHSRYDAVTRSYDYYFHFYEDPFLESHSAYHKEADLDIESMKEAAASLTSYKDFRSLCRRSHLFPNTRCDVSFSRLYISEDKKRMRLAITSDRFLQGMIRVLVHFLIQIGTRKMTLNEFQTMISTQGEVAVKRQAKPEGLYLSRITYPYLKVANHSAFDQILKTGLNN